MRLLALLDRNRGGHVRRAVLMALLVLSARPAVALDVGTVVAAEGTADITRDKAQRPAALNAPISVGDELRTGSPGRADLAFFDRALTTTVVGEKAAAIVSSLAVGPNSFAVVDKYEFDPRGPKARFLLMRGRAAALVGQTSSGYEIKTPTAVALATGTRFVVTYDPAAEVTEVVGVSGRLRVAGLAGREVWVSAREITTVSKGQPPTPPRPVPEEQFQQYLEGLTFIGGGRPESLSGTIPAPERFVLVAPPPDTLDLCPGTSAPTCVTQQPLSGAGNLDINF